ncbi:hypothetical protein BHE74_00058106, partial [Ensete ventricosum]
MEESIKSSTDSAFFSKVGSASSEESGWTIYFEDFMATAAEKAGGVFSSGAVSESSVVSDAASSVAWKLSASFEVTEDYRELSLKKRKGKRLVDDDSLEDTASSPVHSPKVTDFNYLTKNTGKKDDHRDSLGSDDAMELVESSLGVRQRNQEARWEHTGSLPEEDHKTRCKNVRGCRISG